MAAAEAKVDALDSRLHEKNEQWEGLATHVNSLELELVRSKQALGEAMNQINDYELGVVAKKRKK